MKTTLEIPDDLFRAAKAKAALEGRKLKDLVTEALRRAVRAEPSGGPGGRRIEFPLIKGRPDSPVLTAERMAALEAQLESAEAERYARLVRR